MCRDAMLVWRGGDRVRVTDNGSTNGTYVNGRRIHGAVEGVFSEMSVEICGFWLTFEITEGRTKKTAPPRNQASVRRYRRSPGPLSGSRAFPIRIIGHADSAVPQADRLWFYQRTRTSMYLAWTTSSVPTQNLPRE